jgi:hypothetical protein
MPAPSSRATVSAKVHHAALAELQALRAENECLREELRRHSSGALQIRAASRNARQGNDAESRPYLTGLREILLVPVLSRIFRR